MEQHFKIIDTPIVQFMVEWGWDREGAILCISFYYEKQKMDSGYFGDKEDILRKFAEIDEEICMAIYYEKKAELN